MVASPPVMTSALAVDGWCAGRGDGHAAFGLSVIKDEGAAGELMPQVFQLVDVTVDGGDLGRIAQLGVDGASTQEIVLRGKLLLNIPSPRVDISNEGSGVLDAKCLAAS